MKIGFVGLGIMGRHMAKNLIKAGHELVVYDKYAATDDFVEMGVPVAKSNAELASMCNMIITMLPNSPHVREAVLGENGILEKASPGTILVDMSSIAPQASKEISQAVAKKGVVMLDAPVSGGEPKAIDGTLAIMVGGPLDAFEQVKPILQVMGSSVVRIGDIGAGNITKLANQIIVALNIAAVSEAFVLATKAGVDPESVFAAIKGGLAGSTVMNAKVPMILDGNFKPGFRIELHIKDLQNALDTAHELQSPLPLTSVVMETMQALKAHDMASLDHSAIVRYYEMLAKTEVRHDR